MVFKHVALGGTFDHFHKGHEVLLRKAVEIGDSITVGITSDRLAGRESEPYEVRKTAVERNLERLGCKRYFIVSLEDPFGPATTDESMDSLVVSEETYSRAIELNRIRKEGGLEELEIIRIPMLHAEDRGSLSSSRIRQGEIDRNGRIL
jgi:pantetheine-phosphate adenylyltransferase